MPLYSPNNSLYISPIFPPYFPLYSPLFPLYCPSSSLLFPLYLLCSLPLLPLYFPLYFPSIHPLSPHYFPLYFSSILPLFPLYSPYISLYISPIFPCSPDPVHPRTLQASHRTPSHDQHFSLLCKQLQNKKSNPPLTPNTTPPFPPPAPLRSEPSFAQCDANRTRRAAFCAVGRADLGDERDAF